MERYYLNRRNVDITNKNIKVHKSYCHLLPFSDFIYLGLHPDHQSAIIEAKKYYNVIDGHIQCNRPIHKEVSIKSTVKVFSSYRIKCLREFGLFGFPHSL